ncbi:SpoIIE family protein phosphatase [Phaeodactylibacter luteus]|uniref:SpoIIE family protein phosphatase n=1 Tax=Phaeodactylibacter luteus TaxID=1564516 RepID=A0A5C6RGG5_9BACT|nr:SpoIIE family protein phosphatase [Phaeodactylibacter luteus]
MRYIETFKINSHEDISERFLKSLQTANQQVILTTDGCQGMKTTFCGVVWDLLNGKIYYTNLGDSRIYEFADNEFRQISTDEVKSVILRKKDGKPLIISGVVVTAEGVTNVIGSREAHYEIKVKNDEAIKGVILSTDGMHGASSKFEEDLLTVINAIDLENGLEQICQEYKDIQKDDMTIIALRKINGKNNYSKMISSILNNEDFSGMSNFEISKVLLQGIEEGIKEKNAFIVNKLLSIREIKRIDFGREKIGDLISLMFKVDFQDGEVYQKLLSIMRSSKI